MLEIKNNGKYICRYVLVLVCKDSIEHSWNNTKNKLILRLCS
jgi:hypothetical protein